MIVMKFGGVSLKDDINFVNVIHVVQQHKESNLVVVVSAMKDVTDLLIDSIHLAVDRNQEQLDENLMIIKQKHISVVKNLIKDSDVKQKVLDELNTLFDELENLLSAVFILKEYTKKSWDRIISFGERLCSYILTNTMVSQGLSAEQIYGEEVIVTDSNFNFAYPNPHLTKEKANARLLPILVKQIVPVVAGFTGATVLGETTTLGRGGSDLTASILASSLECDEVWFLKEVDGIMTHDPKIVPDATLIEYMSYSEVAELSYFGAQVLHPIAIHPLIQNGIPARIKSVYNSANNGTTVTSIGDENASISKPVKAISTINDICLLTIQGEGMIGIPGVAAKVFSCLAQCAVNVLMISQSSSEQNICVVISNTHKDLALAELTKTFETEILKGLVGVVKVQDCFSIVSLVGKQMAGTYGVSGKIFSILGENEINVAMIAQGSSELNISFLIQSTQVTAAVELLHKSFCLHE